MVNQKRRDKIRYLSGEQLRRAVIAGAHRVIAHRDVLDRINVFPVPDSDTGSNLTATMQAIVAGLKHSSPSLAAVSATVASSALVGARGNSGVIMAQFFQGLREGLADHLNVTVAHFVEAAKRAAIQAREALATPCEGTILTVIRDFVDHIENRSERLRDFLSILEEGLRAARRSLAETKEKLAALRKAGVVDAGALGFVHFLEGFVSALKGETVDSPVSAGAYGSGVSPILHKFSERIDFRYCAEALVKGTIDRPKLKQRLMALGDSIVVAGSENEAHVHIHSNAPAFVLEALSEIGEVHLQKVEDMLADLDISVPGTEREKIALVTDSVCDLPQEFLTASRIQVVPAQVVFGDKMFLDRVEITPREFYTRLVADPVFPKTSQPAPVDFLLLYRYLSQYYEGILSIHLSSGVSGTFQTAVSAARTVTQETGLPIRVVDSRTASVAEGLVVWAAARAADASLSLEACSEIARIAAEGTKVFVFVPTVKYFVRGGRLSPVQGKIAEWCRITPILTVKDGAVAPVSKAVGRRNAVKKTLSFVVQNAIKMRKPMFAIAHSAAPELAEQYGDSVRGRFPQSSVMITEAGPALGAHAGPGGAAIALLDVAKVDRLIEVELKKEERP
jgi:DegV family protein with EDD domain